MDRRQNAGSPIEGSITARAKPRPDPNWGIAPTREWGELADWLHSKADLLPRSPADEALAKAEIAACLQSIYTRYFHGALVDRGLAEREKLQADRKRGFSWESPRGRNEARKLRAVTAREREHVEHIGRTLQLTDGPLPVSHAFPMLDPASRRRMTRAIRAVKNAGDAELARFKIELAAAYSDGWLSPPVVELCVRLGVLEADLLKAHQPYELAIAEAERREAELYEMRDAMPRGERRPYQGRVGRPRKYADHEAAEGIRDLLRSLSQKLRVGKYVKSGERRYCGKPPKDFCELLILPDSTKPKALLTLRTTGIGMARLPTIVACRVRISMRASPSTRISELPPT